MYMHMYVYIYIYIYISKHDTAIDNANKQKVSLETKLIEDTRPGTRDPPTSRGSLDTGFSVLRTLDINTCIYIYIYIYIYILHTHVCVSLSLSLSIYIYIYTYAYMYVYIYIYIHFMTL